MMATPPLRLEQVGRKWRVVREDVPKKWSVVSPTMSRKEAEWFMTQLQGPTENAIEEWIEVRTEAEREDYERFLEAKKPRQREWIRQARADGRVTSVPPPPKMTKKRYLKLLKQAQEEGDGGVLERD